MKLPDYFVKCHYEGIIKDEPPMAKRLALFIQHEFKPQSVIDIGCGPGLYVASLLERGISSVGIDIDPRIKDYRGIPAKHPAVRPNLHQADIASNDFKASKFGTFDLSICLEVVEHIPENFASIIVNNICSCADRVILSAAVPGQKDNTGGHHNCQWKPYWLDLFLEQGFHFDAGASDRMLRYIRNGYHMRWFTNNAMVLSTLDQSTSPVT